MSGKFLDIEEAVTVWAHREFDKTATRFQRKLKAKEIKTGTKIIQLLIDWTQVKIQSETSWLDLEDLTKLQSSVQSSSDTKVLDTLVPADTLRAISLNKPSASVLFQTSFNNNTDSVQHYTMKTEKTSHSSMSTELEKGFTKGIEMELKLQTPCEIFEANVGYKREFSLNNTQGETFEEEVSWGVEADIEVQPGHLANACLVIEEKKQSGKFVVTTNMSGMVYVTFTNLHDNNSFIKCTGHDLAAIIKEYQHLMSRKGKDIGGVVNIEANDVVVAKTSGMCKFRYGVKQEVILNQRPLRIH